MGTLLCLLPACAASNSNIRQQRIRNVGNYYRLCMQAMSLHHIGTRGMRKSIRLPSLPGTPTCQTCVSSGDILTFFECSVRRFEGCRDTLIRIICVCTARVGMLPFFCPVGRHIQISQQTIAKIVNPPVHRKSRTSSPGGAYDVAGRQGAYLSDNVEFAQPVPSLLE